MIRAPQVVESRSDGRGRPLNAGNWDLRYTGLWTQMDLIGGDDGGPAGVPVVQSHTNTVVLAP